MNFEKSNGTPNNEKPQRGEVDTGRRNFLRGAGAFAGGAMLGVVTNETRAESSDSGARLPESERHRSKSELEEEYKFAEIEKTILSQLDNSDIHRLVKSSDSKGILKLYIDRISVGETGIKTTSAGAILGAGIGYALGKKGGTDGGKESLAGAALGAVAGGIMTTGLLISKYDKTDIEIATNDVAKWIDSQREQGSLNTEDSARDAIKNRYNELARKQEVVQKQLVKM